MKLFSYFIFQNTLKITIFGLHPICVKTGPVFTQMLFALLAFFCAICVNTYLPNKRISVFETIFLSWDTNSISSRVRDDPFFRDLRSLTIILLNRDLRLRSLTITFWKSHDRRSRSWSAIIYPIIINMGNLPRFHSKKILILI